MFSSNQARCCDKCSREIVCRRLVGCLQPLGTRNKRMHTNTHRCASATLPSATLPFVGRVSTCRLCAPRNLACQCVNYILQDYYWQPFKTCVQEADAASIMCSYNAGALPTPSPTRPPFIFRFSRNAESEPKSLFASAMSVLDNMRNDLTRTM